jgi:hypothetical protein
MSGVAVSSDLLVRAKAGDGDARLELARAAAREGKRAEADHWISEAASVGQLTAVLQTAAWKLSGHRGPQDVSGGAAIVRDLADRGDAAAKALLAGLLAAGVFGRTDWNAARAALLDAGERHDPRALLQIALMLPREHKWDGPRIALFDRAAGKGYPPALFFAGRALLNEGGQDSQALARLTLAARGNEPNALKLLRGRRTPSAALDSPVFELTPVNWHRIGAALIWPHERSLPQPIMRYATPRVTTLNRLLAPEECDYVISRGAPFLKQAQTTRIADAGERSQATARFGLAETDALIQSIDALVSRAAGEEPGLGRTFALLHYAPGQRFSPNGARAEMTQGAAQLVENAQVTRTIMVYLNDGYEGGESVFPRLGWRFKGKRGDALVWDIRSPDGAVDPRAIPEGMPPRAGDKFILSKWIRRPA